MDDDVDMCECGCGCEPDGDWHWSQRPWCPCVSMGCPCVTDVRIERPAAGEGETPPPDSGGR